MSAPAQRRALVLGGTGAVGSEVLRELARAGVPAAFTWLSSEERAAALEEELGHEAHRVDLADPGAVRTLISTLAAAGRAPDVLVHAAAVSAAHPLPDVTDEHWHHAVAVNAHSALVAAQALAPHMEAAGGGDIVLIGALDRQQSAPIPVVYAATQGLLSAMTMALAKELGRAGVRVNLVAVGPLASGLSRDMDDALVTDYREFSALRRLGTAAEVAVAVRWLALENTYMSGKVLPVNGGI